MLLDGLSDFTGATGAGLATTLGAAFVLAATGAAVF